LQNAGLTADDQRFQQTMAAVDALLKVHGAAMDHVQGMHDRDTANAQLDLQRQAQQQAAQAPAQ